jgi:two-component system cell cycle response regulator
MPGRILIADDQMPGRILLKARLAPTCRAVIAAERRADVPALARAEQPDVVVIDLGDPAEAAMGAIAALRADPATAETGIVALLPPRTAPGLRLAALEAGADEVLARPPEPALLLARIRSLLRTRDPAADLGLRDEARAVLGLAEAPAGFEGPGRVALVAARAEATVPLRAALARHLRDRIELLRPEAVVGPEAGPPADAYVIVAEGGATGLIAELRSRKGTRDAAILALLPEGEVAQAVSALDTGADEAVTGPVDPREVLVRLRRGLARKARADRQRRHLSDGLHLAVTDPLTGLFNRRYALAHLDRVARQAAQTGRPFAVMVLDLDRFKQVNDRHGHAVGDTVLVEVARRLAAGLRAEDLLARIGGEEFLAILPDMPPAAAGAAAERLRRAVAERPVALPATAGGAREVAVTVSIGVALGPVAGPVEALVAAADRALYAAKADGRNQVTFDRSAA